MKSAGLKCGVIVQGPIRSPGLSGATLGLRGKRESSASDFIDYDCTGNVRRIVGELSGKVEAIVVSTWEGEWKGEPPAGAELVASRPLSDMELGLRRAARGKNRNDHRQVHSTRAGLDRIMASHPDLDFVLKVRTDQYVDVEATAAFVAAHRDAFEGGAILFPSVRADYTVHDFYFGAAPATLRRLLDDLAAWAYVPLCPNVHANIYLKHTALRLHGDARRAAACGATTFDVRLLGGRAYEAMRFGLSQVVVPAPAEVFCRLEWRGSAPTPEGQSQLRAEDGFGDDWFSGGREALLGRVAEQRAHVTARERAGRALNVYLPAQAAARGAPDLALSSPLRLVDSAGRSILRRLAGRY